MMITKPIQTFEW